MHRINSALKVLIVLSVLLCFQPVTSFVSPAEAKKGNSDEGILITIIILDEETEEPIQTAKVKHSLESDSSRVNKLTGKWQAREVYDAEGNEHKFKSGQTENFSVSAPGYTTRIVKYDVRKRRNNIELKLQKMDVDNDTVEMPIIKFGRDQEREGGSPGGAN